MFEPAAFGKFNIAEPFGHERIGTPTDRGVGHLDLSTVFNLEGALPLEEA